MPNSASSTPAAPSASVPSTSSDPPVASSVTAATVKEVSSPIVTALPPTAIKATVELLSGTMPPAHSVPAPQLPEPPFHVTVFAICHSSLVPRGASRVLRACNRVQRSRLPA